MKKKTKSLIVVFICVILILAGCLIANLTDTATMICDGKSYDISFVDSWTLRRALLVKATDFSEYGCNYNEELFSVKMGGLTYCLSLDDCDTIYIKELNLYYEVTSEDFALIRQTLVEYEPIASWWKGYWD